jgi:hypothetical protein
VSEEPEGNRRFHLSPKEENEDSQRRLAEELDVFTNVGPNGELEIFTNEVRRVTEEGGGTTHQETKSSWDQMGNRT